MPVYLFDLGHLLFWERTNLVVLPFLYKENHSQGEWFKKAYGDEDDRKTPFDIIEVRSANCTKNIKRRTFK